MKSPRNTSGIIGMIAVMAVLSCKGSDDTALVDEFDICGDVDGPGGDTGDVPNVLGKWTVTFASNLYDDGACDVEGLEQDDWTWINGYMDKWING